MPSPGWLLFSIMVEMAIAGVIVLLARRQTKKSGSKEGQPLERVRRSAGNAMLVFQEFTDPRIEHVIEAQQEHVEDDEEAGDDGGEIDETELHEELVGMLGENEVDRSEVRRLLTRAQRAGLDWRASYERATANVLADRPYLAPRMPPPARVAPLE